MFGGDNAVPFVLRDQGRRWGSGYGSPALMDPAGIFATSPGWRIVAAVDGRRLRGTDECGTGACKDPVLVIEHVDLYGTADKVPDGDLDYIIRAGDRRHSPHRQRRSP